MCVRLSNAPAAFRCTLMSGDVVRAIRGGTPLHETIAILLVSAMKKITTQNAMTKLFVSEN